MSRLVGSMSGKMGVNGQGQLGSPIEERKEKAHMAAHPLATGGELHTKRPVWKALETHYKRVRELHLRDLFANDPARGERMVAQGAGIYLDYSKNRITDQTLKLLTQLAEESGLQIADRCHVPWGQDQQH